MDGDIYGPSLPTMLGLETPSNSRTLEGDAIQPFEKWGIKVDHDRQARRPREAADLARPDGARRVQAARQPQTNVGASSTTWSSTSRPARVMCR
jgi:hypothetical protein